MLNDCIMKGRFPRNARNMKQISRKHFAQALGVTPSLLSGSEIILAYEGILETVEPLDTVVVGPGHGANPDASEPMDANALQVVFLHPELLKHQHYPVGSSAREVVAILNGQICNGGLERSRGGKISRKVVTRKLGLSQTAMTRFLAIFTDYEDAVGGKEAVVETKIPAMRSWFEAAMADGSLQIRDGKVSRIQFYERFGLPHSKTVLIRYPRIAAVVQEYDEKVRATDYKPSETASDLRRLAALLADDPPLGKEGRTINRREISRLLGIAEYRFKRSPFIEEIQKAESKLLSSLERDLLIGFAGGRLFSFKSLTENGWSRSYASRLKDEFERVYKKKSKDEAKTHFHTLCDLLVFLARSDSRYCRSVVDGLNSDVSVRGLTSEFTRSLQEYRDHLRAANEMDSTCNLKISVANSVVRRLSAHAVLPTPTLYLIGFREDKSSHISTVAEAKELNLPTKAHPHVDDYLVFATSMLKQAAELRQIDLGKDAGEFSKVLREELEAETFNAAENPASVILRVLERRITLIRRAAWAVVEHGQLESQRGAELLARAVDPSEDFDRIISGEGMSKTERNALLRQYFPGGDLAEQGIANLLKLLDARYHRIFPASQSKRRSEGQFFQKRALEYGSARQLQGYLIPSQEVVSAVLTLYLLESGSNVSVGRTLYIDCIEDADEPHHIKVTGYKARAAGKPIFAVMEQRSEAVKAMTWLSSAVQSIPGLDRETKKQLFLAKGLGVGMKLIEEFTYRADFKRLIASIPELSKLSMTPNMLRPSILLKAALESDGRTNLSQAIGQHGKMVHEGYVNRHPLRYLRDTEIRHFQHSLETVVIQAIKDAHALLGVDVEGMARRVEMTMATGLGTLCANRNGRPGNEGSPCTSIDCWNDCPQLIVIAKKEEVAILQIWQHSLRLVEGDWIRDQPERWEAVWLPWLCFIDAIEVKMLQSFGQVWRAASVVSSEVISHPSFVPMRLF